MKNIILFCIGCSLFQFLIGLCIYQAGFDNGRKAKVDDIVMTACMHGKPIYYGKDAYDIICLLHNNPAE